MKFLVPFLSILVISQFALAAKHVVVVDDDATTDANTTTTTVHHRRTAYNDNAVVRDLIPQVGLVMADSTMAQSSSRTGLVLGADVDLFKFGGNWTFETGLQYKQMGTSMQASNANYVLNYLVIPVAAKYYFEGEHVTGFFAKGGFMPGLNIAHSRSDLQGNNSQDLQNINTFDVGVLFGAGGKIALSKSVALLLEADYVRGLIGISTAPPAGTGSVDNTALSFVTGVSIDMM